MKINNSSQENKSSNTIRSQSKSILMIFHKQDIVFSKVIQSNIAYIKFVSNAYPEWLNITSIRAVSLRWHNTRIK